jgi:hypothetical protein
LAAQMPDAQETPSLAGAYSQLANKVSFLILPSTNLVVTVMFWLV